MSKSDPKVDPEFVAHLPPLTPQEEAGLTAELKADGCLDSVVVWRETGIILDGHNRQRICDAEGIPYSVRLMSFPDRAAALLWIAGHQVSRRNLSAKARAKLALPAYLQAVERSKEKRKENLRRGGRSGKNAENPRNPHGVGVGETTTHEAAETAGVSVKTMERAAAESAAKEQAEEKPTEPPKDRLDHPLPDVKSLRDAFARDDEIYALMKEVSAIKGKVLKLAKAYPDDVKPNAKDPIWKFFDLSEFERSIGNARTALKMIRPYAICPYCWAGERQDLKHCTGCDGKGWTDEFHYATAPKDFKEPPQ